MRCPDTGELRAWVDEPTPAAAEHLAACADCTAAVAELRRNAALAAPALALLAPASTPTPAAVDAAWERVADRADTPQRAPAHGGEAVPQPAATVAALPPRRSRLPRRLRLPAAAAAAALALVLVVVTPGGRSAAATFLAQFRSDHFAVVTVDPNKAEGALRNLDKVGTVSGDLSTLEPERVTSVAEASRQVGFEVRTPDPASMPAGVGTTPQVLVSPARQVRFTFDADKARRSLGEKVDLPARFDGASLVIALPAGVVLQYQGGPGQLGLVVGQAGRLRAWTEGGVTLEDLRAFLLELPGLPKETTDQLRAIDDWRNTLPLPIPAGQVDWKKTSVDGGDALQLGDGSGLGSAVIGQRDGHVYGVGGPFPAAEVKRVAERLR
jgi:hypothetical protein